jgi:hypothetical protein
MRLRPCSDARLRQLPVMPPTLVLFIGGQSGLSKGSGLAGLADVAGGAAGHRAIIARLIMAGGRYSVCRTRAGGFRVAASPGSAAITAAAASQLAAMIDSAASGTATTGVMPS